jgi:hypothetical protein
MWKTLKSSANSDCGAVKEMTKVNEDVDEPPWRTSSGS